MLHQILLKNKQYSVNVEYNGGYIMDRKFNKRTAEFEKYADEYSAEEVKQIISDLKGTGTTVIIYEIIKKYQIVTETMENRDGENLGTYQKLELVPTYKKIDTYKNL